MPTHFRTSGITLGSRLNDSSAIMSIRLGGIFICISCLFRFITKAYRILSRMICLILSACKLFSDSRTRSLSNLQLNIILSSFSFSPTVLVVLILTILSTYFSILASISSKKLWMECSRKNLLSWSKSFHSSASFSYMFNNLM